MRMRLVVALAALLGVWGSVSPAMAQKKPTPPPAAPKGAKPGGGGQGKGQNAQQRGQPPVNPAKELERFLGMPPEDREKALAKLPPQQRTRMEQQIQHFENLPPAQRENQLRRLEAFQNLPQARRPVVRQEIEDLRALPRAVRIDRLGGEEFKQSFSPEEQKYIREAFPGIAPPNP
jgi:hypothetical protein